MYDYAEQLQKLIKKVEQTNEEKIKDAAGLIAGTIKDGGVLHVFASGHSHMLMEELFYRAGGLVPINPIFEPSLMLNHGAVKSSSFERVEGIAKAIIRQTEIKSGEPIIIISNSGINAVPVEMAKEVKELGMKVICLTSLSASKNLVSRHSSGKKLYDYADVILDNCVEYGDAITEVDGMVQKMGPASTIIGAFIVNGVMIETAKLLISWGSEVPVLMSSNIPGGSEYNAALIKKYQNRIHWF
jgi:uncharacterized phosphosugar-binding protein